MWAKSRDDLRTALPMFETLPMFECLTLSETRTDAHSIMVFRSAQFSLPCYLTYILMIYRWYQMMVLWSLTLMIRNYIFIIFRDEVNSAVVMLNEDLRRVASWCSLIVCSLIPIRRNYLCSQLVICWNIFPYLSTGEKTVSCDFSHRSMHDTG
jgi:hypothetical protein